MMQVKGHKLTVAWNGERGAESSSTGFCSCGNWTESGSTQKVVREEYRHHLEAVRPRQMATKDAPWLSLRFDQSIVVRFVDFNRTAVLHQHWNTNDRRYNLCEGVQCRACLGANKLVRHFLTLVEVDGEHFTLLMPFPLYKMVFECWLTEGELFSGQRYELRRLGGPSKLKLDYYMQRAA